MTDVALALEDTVVIDVALPEATVTVDLELHGGEVEGVLWP